MSGLDCCEECGVPKLITEEYVWMSNGAIVQKRDQRSRIVLTESETFDPLFQNMEKIIGLPIEHIVIDCIRRTFRAYCRLFLPDNMDELRKDPDAVKAIGKSFITLATPQGLGKFEFVDMRFEGDEDDYDTVSIREPYSLAMCVGTHCGAMEALFGVDQGVRYSEVESGLYHLTTFPQEHLAELKGRLRMKLFDSVPGNIELERCASCGGPKLLAQNKWDLDRGVIMNQKANRRLVIMGPNQFDPIFKELEEELGDTIPQVAVEAQKIFTKTGFFNLYEYADTEEFRAGLAMRGLGDIADLKIKRSGLKMTITNSVLPVLIVGMMQGIFDAALHVDSNVEWELSEDGTLEIMVTPV